MRLELYLEIRIMLESMSYKLLLSRSMMILTCIDLMIIPLAVTNL